MLDRSRPVVSYFKEPKRRRATATPRREPNGRMQPCPECQALGETWQECSLCDGEGMITLDELQSWQEARGAS